MLRALLVVAAGCGRLEFGATDPPDAPVGHDEDADGLGDLADPCPHVAGDMSDGDGDGVGDACDPNPAQPTETIVFASLTAGDHPFESIDGYIQEADSLRYNGLSSTLSFERDITNVRFELGFEIHALVGTGQHQLAIGIERGAEPFYFVELNENDAGTLKDCGVISYDIANGYLFLASSTHNGMHVGRGAVRLDATVNNPRFAVVAGWIGEMYEATAPTPAYGGGPVTRIVFNGLDVSLSYFVAILTT
jgi:hypothetical protein